MGFDRASVGLGVPPLSVVAHAVDEETVHSLRARECPEHGENLGWLRNLRGRYEGPTWLVRLGGPPRVCRWSVTRRRWSSDFPPLAGFDETATLELSEWHTGDIVGATEPGTTIGLRPPSFERHGRAGTYGVVMTAGAKSLGGGGREARLAHLIITIFGLYARAEGNWLSVSSVVALMADLGGDGQATRSAISRLKRRGVLLSERMIDTAGYSVAAATLEVLAEGDVRIFTRRRGTMDDGWLLVVFSVPESERDKRHALRSSLTRLGFGTVAPGVWVAPGNLAEETRLALESRGLSEYVDMFSSRHLAFGDMRTKVRAWWNLEELTQLYADFLQRYRSALYRATAEELSPQEAFKIYVPMLTQWRRLPYRDPGLPLSLLPPSWNGDAAGDLFEELNAILGPLAQKHAMAVVHGKATRGGNARAVQMAAARDRHEP